MPIHRVAMRLLLGSSLCLGLSWAATEVTMNSSRVYLAQGGVSFGVSADFNNDGKLDIVSSSTTATTLVFTKGNGDGTLAPPVTSGPFNLIPNRPGRWMAQGDFNRDGKADIAFTGALTPGGPLELLISLGDGTGKFLPATAAGIANATSVATADLNGDGKIDLISTNGTTSVAVILGAGNGTFSAPVYFSTGVTSIAASVITSDFNNDRRTDIAVGGGDTSAGSIAILLGNGDGTFQGGVTRSTNPIAGPIMAGDFDGDKKADVAIGSMGSLSVFLGNGAGSVGSAVISTPGINVPVLRAFDLNGDGKTDLIDSDSNTTNVYVLLATSGGHFQPRTAYTASIPTNLVIGDFTGDGRLDIATTGRVITMLVNKGNGTFPQVSVGPVVPQIAKQIGLQDVNGDSRLDALTSTGVNLGNGDGTLGSLIALNGPYLNSYFAAGDFNRDGKVDLVTAGDVALEYFQGLGNGSFAAATLPFGTNFAGRPLAGDLDRDGKLDLLFPTSTSPLAFAKGNGDGTFQAPQPVNIQGQLAQFADFNGDGKLDLLTTHPVAIYLGNGNGTFQAASANINTTEIGASAADLDGDGRQDVLFAAKINGADCVGVALGNGNGTFKTPAYYLTGSDPQIPRAADLDGDGKLDVVTPDLLSQDVSILSNTGSGVLADPRLFLVQGTPTGGSAWDVAAGDLNGDGKLDLVLADRISNQTMLEVLLNLP